jgi:hypothetical protein
MCDHQAKTSKSGATPKQSSRLRALGSTRAARWRHAALFAFFWAVFSAPVQAADIATHTTTEDELESIMLNYSYGGLNSGHMAFKVDIRPNPLTVNGQNYNGYLVVQARDDKNNYCHWYLVIDPRIPAGGSVDWFRPRVFDRDNGCWNSDLDHDFSILAYGLAEWHMQMMNTLQADFNQLPFAGEHPMASPYSSLYATVDYASDSFTLNIGQLRLQPLPPVTVIPKLAPLPLERN